MNKRIAAARRARRDLAVTQIARAVRPLAESLERRTLFAAVSWTGVAGDDLWTTPGNWSGGALPGAADDVTIDIAANPTITLKGASQNIRSLTAAENLQITDAVLGVTSGGVTLIGGAHLALSSTGTFTSLDFRDGDQTLGGKGEVTFNGAPTSQSSVRSVRFGSNNPASLTLAPGVTIRTGGGNGYVGNTDPSTSTTNQGAILSQTVGELLEVAGKFTSSGTVRVSDGVLRLSGAHSATGRTEVVGGVLQLGGTFTQAGLGTFARGGGVVNVTGALSGGLTLDEFTGSWNLAGGTLVGGTYSNDGPAFLNVTASSVLDGVTLESDLTITDVFVGVVNGLTLANDATVRLFSHGAFTSLDFRDGAQTFDGQGSVIFSGGQTFLRPLRLGSSDPASLTIGAGVAISALGGNGQIGNTDALTSTTNQGVIEAPSETETLEIIGKFANAGTVRVADGLLRLTGAHQSTGTIDVQSGALELGGTFTQAGLGTFVRTGGDVNVTGALSGGLKLDASTGSWNLAGGKLVGGTYSASGGSTLNVTSSSAFDGVIVASDLAIDDVVLGVANNLSLSNNAKITLSSTSAFTSLDFRDGDQTLAGQGEVLFAAGVNASFLRPLRFASNDPASITIGSGITLRTAGGSGVIGSGDANTMTINQGTIVSQTAGQTLEISGKCTNSGTLRITDGLIRLTGSYANTGTIDLQGGALQLGGTLTQAALGTLTRSGGVVNLTGTLSDGLALNASTGSWNLAGGRLVGGTYSASDGATLTTVFNSEVDGVVLASDITVTNAVLGVVNNLVLANNAVVHLFSSGPFTSLDFRDGNQTLGGQGEVRLEGSHLGSTAIRILQSQSNDPVSLTLTQGVAVRLLGGGGLIAASSINGSFVNQSVISAEAAGSVLTFNGVVNNAGTIAASNGALLFSSGVFNNSGFLTLGPGTTFAVSGSFNTSGVVTFQIDGSAQIGQYGKIVSNATSFALNGVANVELVGGYQPAAGEVYMLMQFTNASGSFGVVNGLVVNGVTLFMQNLSPSAFTVTATGQGGGGPLAHVTDVFISGNQWAANFLQTLASQGLGEIAAGFHLGAGREATLNLPWTNLDRVSIRFDRAANVKSSDLVIRGARVATYSIAAFNYDALTNTATWTLAAPFGADKILLDLNGDSGGVTTAEGSRPLDGEYIDHLPSGNGSDGGDFRFRLNVLPGDITRNGQVNAADLGQTRRRTPGHPSPLPYDPMADVDGDGAVGTKDQGLVAARLLDSLPLLRVEAYRPKSVRSVDWLGTV